MTAPLLLLIEHPSALLSDAEVSALEAETGGRAVVLRSADRPPLAAPTFFYRALGDADALGVLPPTAGELRVVLVGFGPEEPLPLVWVRQLSALDVVAIQRLTGPDGALADHEPRARARSRVLSVFPGPIVPTSMGSHQRAFGVLEALSRAGHDCDVLITCGNERTADRARVVLSQLCPAVHVNGPSGRKLPPHMKTRRRAELALRRVAGVNRPPPKLFEERLHTAAAFSGRVRLRRLLERGGYDTIIVNYAWMERIRALVPPRLLGRYRWICDTHDVQFVRTETHNRGELRLGFSPERERALELKVLRSFDHVLAISASDAEVLRRHLPRERVLEVPTGFDYAQMEPREPDAERPVFGFIGGAMDANVKAVELLLSSWWPAVVARWPEARLLLAGTISNVPAVADAAFLAKGVERVGFVSSLRDFYASIDALLNPLVVQGGLNFKAVESLMACRLLVTTPMGARCLGDDTLAVIAESADDVTRALEREIEEPRSWSTKRLETRRAAAGRFGDSAAYAPLIDLLERPTAVEIGELAPQTRRVLMQVGDHYENWDRCVGLAEVIRERGHHPIALVYGTTGRNYFLAHGVDVVSLQAFEEPTAVRRSREWVYGLAERVVPAFHRHYDLDDLAAARAAAKGWNSHKKSASRKHALRHIHRIDRMLDEVRPDVLLVWNGYTGITANLLRQAASIRGLPRAFMERSLLPSCVFVDRSGVNGYSRLPDAPMSSIREEVVSAEDVARARSVVPSVGKDEMDALRRAGPWRSARRIIFVPLQVESDTNLLLHSPEIDSMGALVQRVWDQYHDENTAIVVRPHPEETATVKLPTLDGVYVDASGDLHTWIRLADLVVTVNSTVGLTALLHERPVLAFGRSIYSGKGLTGGDPPSRADVDAYLSHLMQRHTGCSRRLPADLEGLVPEVAPTSWRHVSAGNLDVRAWWRRWRAFADTVRRGAIERGYLPLEVNLKPTDRLDLTYRKLEEPVTRAWLERRAREELELPEDVEIRISRGSGDVSSREDLLVVTGQRPLGGEWALDPYFVPWAPTDVG